jgi:hypothetical protein
LIALLPSINQLKKCGGWHAVFPVVDSVPVHYDHLLLAASRKARPAQPVEVPGLVLPAGTYWFVLADIPYCRNVMRIYNEDWSKLYATLITISAYRQQQQNQPEVRLAVRPHHRAQALLQMYYPSFQLGHEFLYADHEEGELRHDAELDVMVRPAGETSSINFRPHS